MAEILHRTAPNSTAEVKTRMQVTLSFPFSLYSQSPCCIRMKTVYVYNYTYVQWAG